MLRPEAPTASIIVDVLDSFRSEIDKELLGARALAESMKAENEQAYRYAIARYKPQGTAMVAIEDYRLTKQELGEFAREHKLDAAKLISVAIGGSEQYKGYRQGPFLRFTFGKRFSRHDDDTPEPQVAKVGVRGFFMGGMKDRTDD